MYPTSSRSVPGFVKVIAGFVAALILLVAIYNMFTVNVTRGSVGVVFAKYSGGTQEAVLPQGVSVVAPWNNVTTLPTVASTYTMSNVSDEGQKKGDDSIPYNTADGQQGWYDVTLKISVNGKQAAMFYNVYQGKDFDTVINESVRFNLKNAVNTVTVGSTIQEAHLTKRNDIQGKTEQNLVANLKAESGKMINEYRKNKGLPEMKKEDIESLFVVYGVTVNGSRVAPTVQKQLDAIAEAEALRQKAIKEAETAEINARKSIAQAKADYEAAQESSKTTRLKADDESYKQTKESQTLTPLLVQKMLVEKLGPNVQVLDVETAGLSNIFGLKPKP